MKGGISMEKKEYKKPTMIVLSIEEIESYFRDHRRCSGCGGKCHRGAN